MLFSKKKKPYSDKLNGYWEEGYHYYLTVDKNRLTVRDYRRAIALETGISYDAAALDRGERTVISLDDNVLSRDAWGKPFTMIRELAYENGELKLLYYYTIMGETLYTLKKVDHGPFDHIKIRDKEWLPRLRGEWIPWHYGKWDPELALTIRDGSFSWFGQQAVPFHVVSYSYAPDEVYLVPANLTDNDFGFCTRIKVEADTLTTREIVMDASVPLTVLSRRETIDTVVIPDEAKEPIRCTMTDFRSIAVDVPPEPPKRGDD